MILPTAVGPLPLKALPFSSSPFGKVCKHPFLSLAASVSGANVILHQQSLLIFALE